jgi:hypothetical protein
MESEDNAVRTLLAAMADGTPERGVDRHDVERRVLPRRRTLLYGSVAAAVAIAAAVTPLVVSARRPGPSGTDSLSAGSAVSCGSTLASPVGQAGDRGLKLTVTGVRPAAGQEPPTVEVTLSTTAYARLSVVGRTPLQVLLIKDGVVMDRIGSYGFAPADPVVDWLAEGPAGRGGRGSAGHAITVTPRAAFSVSLRGPGHCPDADWNTAMSPHAGYTLVAVMSVPHPVEQPTAPTADDPLLVSGPVAAASR